MNIVIVFPTELESQNFHIPENIKHSITVFVSGIGGFATMYSLTKYCMQHKPEMIIHAGIAGTFTDLSNGTVVQVTSDCFADVGVVEAEKFKSIFDLNFIDANTYPFTKGKLELHAPKFDFLPQVSAVTVNTISSTEQQKQMLMQTYNSIIESMEGATVHYIALQEHIPCIHIRAISNKVGERDKSKWEIDKALKKLYESLIILINMLEAPLTTPISVK